MALPDISLAQFNRIASGEYNAGLVEDTKNMGDKEKSYQIDIGI